MDKVPGFILKLWKIINDPRSDDLISWSDNGQSFIILDPPRFSQELSKYFKHNNLSSFIRQLNMYGFKKVASIENQEDLHFYHPDFVRNEPQRLEAIKRKLPQRAAESLDYRNIVQGLNELEDKQKDVAQSLSEIKRENEMLWAELHDLRQKHQQQEHYIGRLMKLVFDAMEQNGIRTNTLQFEGPLLMIEQGASQVSPPPSTLSAAQPQQQQQQQQLQPQQPQHQVVDSAPQIAEAIPDGMSVEDTIQPVAGATAYDLPQATLVNTSENQFVNDCGNLEDLLNDFNDENLSFD